MPSAWSSELRARCDKAFFVDIVTTRKPSLEILSPMTIVSSSKMNQGLETSNSSKY